ARGARTNAPCLLPSGCWRAVRQGLDVVVAGWLVLASNAQTGPGVAYSDSGSFTLDTTGTAPDSGGVAYADSGTFILDTSGAMPGVGGVAWADSAGFILDT